MQDQDAQQADWELYTEEVARAIVAEQTPRRLYEVRGSIQGDV